MSLGRRRVGTVRASKLATGRSPSARRCRNHQANRWHANLVAPEPD